MSDQITIEPATSPEDLEQVRQLFVEYEGYLGVDLCFQDFDSELASLPGAYAPPKGALLLARVPGVEAVGCVVMRPLENGICEMKRLYLREDFRGHGQGRALALAIVGAARDAGYSRMRLDTLARLTASIALYRSLGFVEIQPYRHNPHNDVVYLEIELDSQISC